MQSSIPSALTGLANPKTDDFDVTKVTDVGFLANLKSYNVIPFSAANKTNVQVLIGVVEKWAGDTDPEKLLLSTV